MSADDQDLHKEFEKEFSSSDDAGWIRAGVSLAVTVIVSTAVSTLFSVLKGRSLAALKKGTETAKYKMTLKGEELSVPQKVERVLFNSERMGEESSSSLNSNSMNGSEAGITGSATGAGVSEQNTTASSSSLEAANATNGFFSTNTTQTQLNA